MKLNRTKRLAAGGALILAGVGVGAALATTGSATAADTGSSSNSGSSASTVASAVASTKTAPDQSKPVRSDEHLLTGTTAEKVRALALAKYPGATIERVETDSDGVYEAHIVTKSGQHLIVQVGKDFTVTGIQNGPGAGPGGPGKAGGRAPQGTPPSGTSGSAAPAAPAAS